MQTVRQSVKAFLFVPFKRLTAAAERRKYLETAPVVKLNVGAGGNRAEGWLNLDFFPAPGITFMDASIRWPFDDQSVDAVLCEHMVEHIPKSLARYMLAEMRRVLKPGGSIRIVTPELDWFAKRVLEPANADEEEYRQFLAAFFKDREIKSWGDVINACFYEHGHQYIWSVDELKRAILNAGFADLTVTRAGCPHSELFRDAEGHPRVVGLKLDAIEAFAVEAKVPAASVQASAEKELAKVG